MGKPSINGAQVTHQIRRASGRGRGHLSWDPLNRGCCGWEVGWVEFLAEGTALEKALKQERAQAFWGLKEERGWGEGGVTEKDSLLPQEAVPPAQREAGRRLTLPGLPPQSSHSYVTAGACPPSVSPKPLPPGWLCLILNYPLGGGLCGVESSPFKAFD